MMPWKPAQGPQLLAPFDHQVAGQSSMLRYDSSTVCKPLISRENFVYKTLPDELKEFTPEYRGEIEVEMVERDGYIELHGRAVEDSSEGAPLCYCSKEVQQSSVGKTNGSSSPDESAACKEKNEAQALPGNSCMIRVLHGGSYEVCPSTQEMFYTKDSSIQHPRTQNLNPWSLKNHKRLLDKMRKSQHNCHTIQITGFIMLKNVVAKLKHPCVLDLKIGSRLHGDDASSKKVASQSKKCRETTSSTLGVRLCGMQVYQVNSGVYRSHDKYHGRTLTDHSFKETLREFLNNGVRFRSDLLEPVISRLSQLIHCLQGLNSFRFYASSLLIMYDGEDLELFNGDDQCKESKSVKDRESEEKTGGNLEERIGKIQLVNNKQALSHKKTFWEGSASSNMGLHQNHKMIQDGDMSCLLQDGKGDMETLVSEPVNNSSNNNNSFQHSNLRTSTGSKVESVTECLERHSDTNSVQAFQSYSNVVNSSISCDCPMLEKENCSQSSLFNSSHQNDKSSKNLPNYSRVISKTLEKVDVQMIDFAHTTHKGFIEDSHKHTGPDMDYIQGLSSLVLLFQHLKQESDNNL